MSNRTSAIRRLTGLPRDRSGNVLVEFGLLLPVAMVLLLGLVDYGRAVHERMALQSAARAGGEYAMRNFSDTAGIEQAVQQAGALEGETLTVTTSQFCECPGGASVPCGGTCATGDFLAFVSVTVTKPFATLLPGSVVGSGTSLSGSAVFRIR